MIWPVVRSNVYYMLIASLPHLPRHFEVERTPINRIRLEERLRLLRPEDAQVVRQVQDFLMWDRQPPDRTDAEVIRRYDNLMETITNPLARHIVSYRMDVRTIVSGLRRRRAGLPPPPGVGQWVETIRRNWNQPGFNLERWHPWVRELDQLLEHGDPLAAERLIMGATWNHWRRLADQYSFSFEAVLLYLARWEIVDRWARLDRTQGRQRFDNLLLEALGEYGHIFD